METRRLWPLRLPSRHRYPIGLLPAPPYRAAQRAGAQRLRAMNRTRYARRMWNLLYRFYEHRLRRQIGAGRLPEHVGLILDGNRRYAREQGIPDPSRAYEMGAQKLEEVLLWCSELGISAVTLWVCSTENLKRSRAEVSGILGAVEAKIGALAQDP